jgi:hypothetical protein
MIIRIKIRAGFFRPEIRASWPGESSALQSITKSVRKRFLKLTGSGFSKLFSSDKRHFPRCGSPERNPSEVESLMQTFGEQQESHNGE